MNTLSDDTSLRAFMEYISDDTAPVNNIKPYDRYLRMTFTGLFAASLMCFSSISSANAKDIYIDAGGGGGGKWGADRGFVGGSTVNRGKIAISNTKKDKVYQTERYNFTEYRVNVPNGHYDVRLLFSENNPGVTASGKRVFNVNAEGKNLRNIDIFKEAGGRHKALTKNLYDVVVSDGILNIKFDYVTRDHGPSINAIRILPKKAVIPPPPTPKPTPTPPPPTPKPTPTPPPPTPTPPPSTKHFKSNLQRCPYDSLRTLAEWEALFRGTWNTEHTRTYLPMSQSLDSWQFYNLAYAIDATTAMYEATGKREYLDRALLYVTNVIANAKPSSSLPGSQFKDKYLGWSSQRSDVKNQEVPLFESYMWRYVTRMLRVMKETGVSNDSAYAAKYRAILDFSERNMFDKWFSRNPNSYIYRNRTHMAAHWAYISSNLWLLTSDSARKAKYKQVFDNINYSLPNYKNTNGTPASLHGQMKPHPAVGPTAYFYQDQWGIATPPGSDQTHGGNTIAYIVDAHQTGIGGWTQDDIDKLIVTLDDVLWKGAVSYAYYLDGSGRGVGWWNEGWVKLGRYCPSLQKQLETHPVGRNMQLYANGALNMKFIMDSKK